MQQTNPPPALRYILSWIALQTPDIPILLAAANHDKPVENLKDIGQFLANQPWWLLPLVIAWMGISAFAVKVWKEIEGDAISYTGDRLRRAPRKAYEIATSPVRRIRTSTKHISFKKRYLRQNKEDYGIFNDRGLGLINANRLDLNQVYIELYIKPDPSLERPNIDPLNPPVGERHQISRFLSALEPSHALALVGPPGSGKTTLLHHLLLTFSSYKHRKMALPWQLPILVELRSMHTIFSAEHSPSLSSAIRHYWNQHSKIRDLMKHEPDGWLERIIKSNGAIILIDGLDEVPFEHRRTASTWLDHQIRAEDNRKCKFILTSRPGGYTDAPLERAQVLEVMPFSPKQATRFIENWYLANEFVASGRKMTTAVSRRAKEEQMDLRKRITANAGLHALTVNPLLLTMVCMVHRYRGALPGSRSQLYAEICQVLLERWRQAKGISETLRGEQKLAVLRPLARVFMELHQKELPEAQIIPVIQDKLKLFGIIDPNAPLQFLKNIQDGSGLILERERGRWSFAHKTFQEFLTAEHWIRTNEPINDLPEKVEDEWWRETLLLFSAGTDASRIVGAALEGTHPDAWGLAYQCLIEAQSLNPEVRTKAENRLRESLRSSNKLKFEPAARAFLNLKCRDTIPINENISHRQELVTNAEYQLFLNELPPDRQLAATPAHWTSERFQGNPEDPVLGLYFHQALEFTEWINDHGIHDRWALPEWHTFADSAITFKAKIWCETGELYITETAKDGEYLLPPTDTIPQTPIEIPQWDLDITLALAIGASRTTASPPWRQSASHLFLDTIIQSTPKSIADEKLSRLWGFAAALEKILSDTKWRFENGHDNPIRLPLHDRITIDEPNLPASGNPRGMPTSLKDEPTPPAFGNPRGMLRSLKDEYLIPTVNELHWLIERLKIITPKPRQTKEPSYAKIRSIYRAKELQSLCGIALPRSTSTEPSPTRNAAATEPQDHTQGYKFPHLTPTNNHIHQLTCDILSTPNPWKSRRSLRLLAYETLTLSSEHLPKTQRQTVNALIHILRILISRDQGILQPREGVLLIKKDI